MYLLCKGGWDTFKLPSKCNIKISMKIYSLKTEGRKRRKITKEDEAGTSLQFMKSNVANFEGHKGQISTLSFSENGYYLATAADDACVKLWDLRKLKNFRTIELEDKYEVKDLCFDQSGTYLAVAGTDIRVYLCKQWTDLKVFQDHTAMATGVRFGKHASYIASTSMDRTLKLYGM